MLRHRPRCRRVLARSLLLLAVLAGSASRAATPASLSAQAVRVLGRALTFVQPPPEVPVVAVVYVEGDAASHADAEAIAAEIGHGLTVGSIVLRPVVLSVAVLEAARPAVIIAAAGANGETVRTLSRARHALCVTGELAAVQSGDCMMSIHSDPNVNIVLNPAAARAAGLGFPMAFHMMVREL